MTRLPFAIIAATALLAIGTLSGCGVSAESSARSTPEEDVPFGLLDPDRTPVANPRPGGTVTVTVFLYDSEEERLDDVERRLDSSDLGTVLAVLGEEPSDAERAAGLSSALVDTDSIGAIEVAGGVASIDLDESFTDLDGSDQLVALAQIVFTATGRPGVGQVTFTLGGDSIEIPTGDGSLTSGAVTRDDYVALSPPGS